MSLLESDAERIFLEAVGNHAPDQWPEFLQEACGGDVRLRHRVEALLRAHRQSSRMLDGGGVVAHIDQLITEKPGTLIGPYKLLEQIGEGGMGLVYMAEQQEPLRRKVALKIIKQGMDTKQVIARFEAERQALALMDHANIARILDAGATESGRPYFVMELVRGVPVTEYCDQNELTTNERLGIFVDVCQAVQHAHQKGIIHRDIKPTNVLVTRQDGRPVPKIIDFGVAKATEQRLTEKSHFTEHRQLVGTPEYMSPEQATFCDANVDTRSDIYSLGVLLYELLVGATPFDARELRSRGYDEICRMIRESDAPTPSKRLSALGEAASEISRHRHVEPAALGKLLRGDLDWIAMKALEKDRSRRYETVHSLARDIERHLNDEPVRARPPSAAYRLKKYVRKHRFATAATVGVLVALMVGLALMAFGLARAKDAERAANAERDRANAQLYDARMTAAHAALQEGAVERVDDLLRIYLPSRKDQKDLRGFEWYHLWRESRRAIESPKITNWISIESLDYSPDERHFAYGTWDGELYVLSDRTRAALWSNSSANTGHTFVISSTRFSPDGRLVATASYDKSVILWNAASGDVLASLEFPRAASAVAFSPDGKLLAVGLGVLGEDPLKAQLELIRSNEVQLYDIDAVTKGSELVVEATFKRSLEGCKGLVSSLSFSQDGQWLAAASREAHFCLWNLITGQSHHIPVYETEGKVRCVAFSPVDPHLLATGGGGFTSANRWGETRLWNVDKKDVQSITRFPAAVISLAFSADGTRLAAVDDGHTIGVFNVNDALQRADTIRGHSAYINDIAFSADGRTLASCSADNKIVLWDISQPPLVKAIDAHLSAVVDLDFATDGVIVSAGSDGTARVWDTNSGQKLDEFPLAVGDALSIDVSPDGSTVAVAGGEYPERTPGELSLWSLANRTKLRTLYDGPHTIWSARFSPDGRRIAAGLDRYAARDRGGPGELIIWDTRTFQPLQRLKIEPRPRVRRLAWSPDGKHIATCTMASPGQGGHGPVRLWSLETESSETVYPNADGVLLCALAYSPDGSMIAAGSHDGWIRVWQISDGKRTAAPETLLSAHIGFVWYLDFSPDSRRLVSAGADGTVRIWNIQTGWELMTFRDDSAWQNCAKFSDDGRTLAVGNRGVKSKIRFYRGASDQY